MTTCSSTLSLDWSVRHMANNAVSIDDLAGAIKRELTVYSESVQDKINKAGARAIKDLERKTKDTAPFNARAYHRHYVDYISTKSEDARTGDKKFIWYVAPPAHRLTHLLVHGHETRDGGRTKADPFLKNALDDVLPEYEKAVKEAIENG